MFVSFATEAPGMMLNHTRYLMNVCEQMSKWGSKLPRLMPKLIELESRLLRNLERDRTRFLTWLESSLSLSLKGCPSPVTRHHFIWHILNSENSRSHKFREKKLWSYFACCTKASIWCCSQQRHRFLLRTLARELQRNHSPQRQLLSGSF